MSNAILVYARNRRIFHYLHPERQWSIACSPRSDVRRWGWFEHTEAGALYNGKRACLNCLQALEVIAHVG